MESGANLDITYTLPGYIENLPLYLEAVRYDDETINVESGNSGQFDTQSIALMRDGYHIGIVDVDFEETRDWSNIHGEVDPVNRKSVLTGVSSAPGSASTLSLLVLKELEDIGVGICPEAISLNEVHPDCTGLEIKDGSHEDVSTIVIGGNTYWMIDGLSGTGFGT